jgi:hypothetical protein
MDTNTEITLNKELRRDIDEKIQKVKTLPPSREVSLVITKLQEGVMWLGMNLKRINDATGVGANPYPNSKDPSNTKIDATADGLKL